MCTTAIVLTLTCFHVCIASILSNEICEKRVRDSVIVMSKLNDEGNELVNTGDNSDTTTLIKAIQCFKRVLSLLDRYPVDDKACVNAYMNMSFCYGNLSRLDSALEYSRYAIENAPKNTNAMNNFAYYLALSDSNLALAESLAVLADSLTNSKELVRSTLGLVYFKRGKLSEAEKVFNKLVHDYPGTDSEYYASYYLARIHLLRGQKRKARKLQKNADMIDPLDLKIENNQPIEWYLHKIENEK